MRTLNHNINHFVGFPYGPVPSSGVPSTLFVDLLNDQTVAGNKTITGQTSLIRPAQSGVAEVVLVAGVADAANGFLALRNWTGVNGWFSPELNLSSNNSSLPAGVLTFTTNPGADIGASPIADFRYAIGSGQAATRPLKTERSYGTIVQQLNAYGDITATIIARAGVAEELARWTVSDNTGSYARIGNGTAVDGLFSPEIGGYLASTSISALTRFSTELAVDAASSSAAMVFQTRVGPVTSPVAVANRTPFAWMNGPNVQMLLTPAGNLQILTANAGLQLKAGTRARRVTLSGGTVTIADASVTANTICLSLARTVKSGTLGQIDIAFTAGVGYTITSTSGTEASTFDLVLAELIP